MTKEYSRHGISYEFTKGNKATAAEKIMFPVHEEIISVSRCHSWIKKFPAENCSTKDEPNASRSEELHEDALRVTFEENPRCKRNG